MANGKTILIGIVALLFGFMGGSWMTKSSSRELEAKLEEAQDELAALEKQSKAALPMALGLGLLNQQANKVKKEPVVHQLPPDELESDDRGPGRKDLANKATLAPQEDYGDLEVVEAEGDLPMDEEVFNNRYDAMAGSWRLRAAQSRARFEEAANLDEEQKAALSETAEEMNRQLADVVAASLERIDFSQEPEVRDLVDIGVALGEVYQDTDDRLREYLTPEQMSMAMDESFDIFGLADPEIFRTLAKEMEESQ